MKAGLLLDNLDEPAADSYLKLQAMKANVVGTLFTAGTKHKRAVYDQCESVLDHPLYLLRVGGHRQTADEWLADARDALAEMPDDIILNDRVRLVCGNEPNLEPEGFADDPVGYGRLYEDVRARHLSVPALFACPSMGIGGWWTYLETALAQGAKPQGICLNAYDHLIGEVPQVIATCGNVPCYIGEVNTLQADRVPWLRGAFGQLEQAGVVAAAIFIAGGQSYGAWDERYIVSMDECQQLQWAGGDMTTTQEQIDTLFAQNALITKGFIQIREGRWTGADGLDGTIVALNGGKVPDGFAPVFPNS